MFKKDHTRQRYLKFLLKIVSSRRDIFLPLTDCSSTHFFTLSWILITKPGPEVTLIWTPHDRSVKKKVKKVPSCDAPPVEISPWRGMTESLDCVVSWQKVGVVCVLSITKRSDSSTPARRGARRGGRGETLPGVGVLGEFRKCCFQMARLQREKTSK